LKLNSNNNSSAKTDKITIKQFHLKQWNALEGKLIKDMLCRTVPASKMPNVTLKTVTI